MPRDATAVRTEFTPGGYSSFAYTKPCGALLLDQAGRSIPIPFLAVLNFWLAMTFASFGMFARLNVTLVAVLFVYALSAAGAIFLILELSHPFAGLMQLSSMPLRNALAPL